MLRSGMKSLLSWIEHLIDPRRVRLSWERSTNWGDALNPFIVEALTGRPVIPVNYGAMRSFIVIGSVIEKAGQGSSIWGAGLMYPNTVLKSKPDKVYAVRGPLTREILLSNGVECPSVYGDPAVLLPLLHRPRQSRKDYAVGIVPHYVDADSEWIAEQRHIDGVKIIDVRQDTFSFVEQVVSCDAILSSSLHGLICADAYGVPNAHVRISEAVGGGAFKFDDYRLGVGGDRYNHLDADDIRPLADCSKVTSLCDVSGSQIRLLSSCPFLDERVAKDLASSINGAGASD